MPATLINTYIFFWSHLTLLYYSIKILMNKRLDNIQNHFLYFIPTKLKIDRLIFKNSSDPRMLPAVRVEKKIEQSRSYAPSDVTELTPHVINCSRSTFCRRKSVRRARDDRRTHVEFCALWSLELGSRTRDPFIVVQKRYKTDVWRIQKKLSYNIQVTTNI